MATLRDSCLERVVWRVLARRNAGGSWGMGEGAYGGACGCEDGAAFFVDRHHVRGGGGFGDGGGEGEGGVD